jgi:uncharacterized protein
MSAPDTQTPKKKLNVPVIKGVVMMLVGAFFGLLGALTGISPQIAAVPIIVFLLGFQPARAQGTALAYSLCVAIGGVAGATASGLRPDYTVGLIIAFGATLGAVAVAKPSTGPNAKLLLRIGQSLAILVSIYVIGEALKQRVGGPKSLGIDLLLQNRAVGALVVGLAVGILAQLFHIAMGVVLVPALIYLAARPVSDSVATSLVVVGIASLLPALSYSAKGAVDKGAGYWMCVGGLLGALSGGALLGQFGIDSVIPLVLFGVSAMILSGWTLSRMS